jgi:hypothetical protein
MAHLRLISDKPTPRPRRAPRRLMPEQRERLCVAFRSLHRLYGGWEAVAEEMGVTKSALVKAFGGRGGSMAMLVTAAGLLKVPVERLLSGELVGDACDRGGGACVLDRALDVRASLEEKHVDPLHRAPRIVLGERHVLDPLPVPSTGWVALCAILFS